MIPKRTAGIERAVVTNPFSVQEVAQGLYTYVWKTDRTWKGTCRELNLKLADGSNHSVQFRFT